MRRAGIYHSTATMRLKAVFANTGEVLWPGESRLQTQSLAPCAAAEKRLYPPFGIGCNASMLEHVVRVRFTQRLLEGKLLVSVAQLAVGLRRPRPERQGMTPVLTI